MRQTPQARILCALLVTIALVPLATASAQKQPPRDSSAHRHAPGSADEDSAFRALQERGRKAMGVDQYTSTHRFDDLRDGGRIELRRDGDDSTGTATIRAHLRDIKAAFESGDFSTPAFVHLRAVPGTAVMAERTSRIRYDVRDLPRGAELRITTTDPTALAAIHQFLAFQRGDHHAGGMDLGRKQP
jgi:hypothetical protein